MICIFSLQRLSWSNKNGQQSIYSRFIISTIFLYILCACIYPKKEDDMGRMITIEKNDQTMLFFFYGQTRTSLTSLDSHNTFRLSITLLPTHQ